MKRFKEGAKKDVRVEINKKHEEIIGSLARLSNHFYPKLNQSNNGCNWGHYGDANQTAYDLKEICDRVFKEGEYA